MPATDPELDALRERLSAAIVELDWLRAHTTPHINVRAAALDTWEETLAEVRAVRDELYKRAHR
jgi:hypothetical protein